MKERSRSKENRQAEHTSQKVHFSISWAVCFRVVVAAFVLYLAMTWWKPLMGFVWKILSAALPLFIGFAAAYVVNILMEVYERKYFVRSTQGWVRKTRRPVCLIGAIVTVLGAVALLLWIIIPSAPAST